MELKGIGVCEGTAVGTAVVVGGDTPGYMHVRFSSAENEKMRLRDACERFRAQTQVLADAVRAKVGAQEAAIVESQTVMLDDPYMCAQLAEAIDSGLCAEAAVDKVCSAFAALFAAAADELTAQRAADLRDIRARMLGLLLGHAYMDIAAVPPGTVLVAREFTPSMTAGINRANVAALVAQEGGMQSHAAILARALELPAVLGVPDILAHVADGDSVAVDGARGVVEPAPDRAVVARYRAEAARREAERRQLRAYRHRATASADGEVFTLCANIGGPEDAVAALEMGAEGVGLLRTEFLFMGRALPPTEEEQYAAYAAVARRMGEREVVIRTLDIGGDKNMPCLGMEQEENPFLGCRALRWCLAHREVFAAQLRALLRAGALRGNIRILLPLVTCLEELRDVRAMLEEQAQALLQAGHAVDTAMRLGVMIETPAAVLAADLLAQEADFFSVGTNDLTQYILAADRGNAQMGALYSPFHPAVLRAVKSTAEAARAAGIPVKICGEAAADPRMIPLFMAFGFRELSVNPAAVPRIRREIARWTMRGAKQAAQAALAQKTAAQVAESLAQACGQQG